MKFIDSIIAPMFKKDSAGRQLFCPWGINRAYIIDSEETYQRAHKDFKSLMWFSFLVAVITPNVFRYSKGNIYLPLIVMGISFILLMSVYTFLAKKYTNGLQKSSEKITYNQHITQTSQAHSWPNLFFLELTSLAFVYGGYFIISNNPPIGYLTMGFGAICAVAIFAMIVVKLISK